MSTADMSTNYADADRLFARKKLLSFAAPILILGYLVYVFFAFDILGLAERARYDNLRILVSDSYSYKTHVTRDKRNGGISYSIEGERKGAYPEGEHPEWVQEIDEETVVIDLGKD